jgi:glycosyltransferase involved in cell wall biosynthesis
MKASVAMITYRHEAYVAQAIESILAQRTSFDFEIIIGEDHSPDRTGDIVRDYAAKYPGRIRLLLRESNVGMMRNFVDALAACTGQYTAVLEGDDYWSDPEKLQRMADAMDANPGWTACFHRFRYIYNDGRESRIDNLAIPPTLGVADLMASNPIQGGSVMFRQGVVREFPPGFLKLGLGDWPIAILHADRGPIGFLDRIMTDYRVHSGGIWSLTDERHKKEKIAGMFECITLALKGPARRATSNQAANHYLSLARDYQAGGDRSRARKFAWHAARNALRSRRFFTPGFQRQLLGIFAPWIIRAGVPVKRMFRRSSSVHAKPPAS